jgi:hypothetical protein
MINLKLSDSDLKEIELQVYNQINHLMSFEEFDFHRIFRFDNHPYNYVVLPYGIRYTSSGLIYYQSKKIQCYSKKQLVSYCVSFFEKHYQKQGSIFLV